ncbi:hypothetical protein TraAM80_05718 [Trypanosoma rangeli]|uniref:Ankyrin repeat protein n=1 Tax=Trypanosoma rangeli TaxID=5698 RepID=A0A422NDC0_TRYRA|nr:uncharacterized protein TraAM80_05718 [Trypanosoma rangeli]RNF03422.1 hypothetical protein TraAM80_05718 [Trypanosoma rangeli]|eukprot:RNF03422.1 hypothetical protein TraAM80_05718 [Trypanosoma rangeli]
MSPKLKRRALEDPNNTWNHQLMQACLQCSVPEAEAVLENGADPVEACEEVPFYKDPLPPLIALVLQGRYTTESVAMMQWLLKHGASVSQFISLHGKDFQTSPGEKGTILHLFVELGQPTLLLDLLMLVGESRPLPESLLKRLGRADRLNNSVLFLSGAAASPTANASRGRQGSATVNASRHTPRGLRPSSSAGSTVPTHGGDTVLHLDGTVIDFEARTSVNGWTAMDLALRRGDATAVQLLLYYGAPGAFYHLVNGTQTALARACARGDKELVEFLLDAGDAIGQISLDGRYTLIHYAAAQPAVLDVLLARGLSIDAVNALGETALVSLICYGQGLNADYAIRETLRQSDAQKLAALPAPALQNYILTPMPPLVTPSPRTMKPLGATAAGMGTDMDFPCLAPVADAWWYFASNCNAWVMIQNLCDRGANVHGDAPQAEVRKVDERAEVNKYGESAVTMHLQPASSSVSYSWLPSEQGDRPENARASASLEGVSAFAGHHAAGKDATLPSMSFVTHLTPLMHAIVAYHPELIRRLAVEYHVDPMVQDAKGACALHYAAIARHPSVMELLISPLVLPTHANFDINVQDCLGRTPLHYAAAHGNSGVVRALLSSCPSLNAGKTDYAGRTALHLAVLAGEAQIVELLLKHGESVATESQSTVSSPSTRKKIATTRRRARVPLIADFHAVEPAAVIDVEAEDLIANQSALEMAVCTTRDPVIARLLLTVGYASVRHSSGLPTGGSLLHRTVVDGSMEIMLLLLENYSDPNETDNLEQTPLHLATQSTLPQACELVRELLRFGAAPDARSGCTLDTPILIAARRGEADMLHLLLHQQEEFTYGKALHSHGTRGAQRDRSRNATRSRSNNNLLSPSNRRSGRQQKQPSPTQLAQRRGRQKQQHQPGNNGSIISEGNEEVSLDATANTNGSVDRRQRDSNSNLRVSSSTGITTASLEGADASGESVESQVQMKISLNPQHLLLTDGQVRTALHYLCSHSDAAKQASLLPVICTVLGCSLGPTLALQVDADGRLPLHCACAAGYVEAVRKLLMHDDGSCAFFLDARGCLPLHYAVLADHGASIKALVQCVGGWLPCTLKGSSAAVDDGCLVPITHRLLQQDIRLQQQEYGDIEGRLLPPHPRRCGVSLLRADGCRNMAICTVWEYLNVHDGMGRTPLLLAAELGHLQASKVLMHLLQKHSKSRRPHLEQKIDSLCSTTMPLFLFQGVMDRSLSSLGVRAP